jgi:hypothetical protein
MGLTASFSRNTQLRLKDTDLSLGPEPCLKGIEAGLNHFDGLGLVRDLNPETIMLQEDGSVVILDLALASLQGIKGPNYAMISYNRQLYIPCR